MTDRTNTSKVIPPERIARIKTLIYYVCAHRVKTYYGTLDNLLKSMAKLKRWSRYSRGQKNLYKNSWADIAKERDKFDACFSIPSGLIKDILGRGRDDDGRQFRFSPTQMIRQLGGFLQRVCKHGHKFAPDHNGKFTIVSGSWGKKYLINEKLFYQLWHDDDMKCYFDLATLGDKKLAKLIARHFKKDSKEQPSENTISTTLLQEEKKMNYQVYATNIPDEDDMLETPTQQATTVKQQNKPKDKPQTSTPSKILPRLQEFTDRDLITAGEARAMADIYGEKINIASHVNGLILQDVSSMTPEQIKRRGKIICAFIEETQNRTLTEKQQGTFNAFISKLDEINKILKRATA